MTQVAIEAFDVVFESARLNFAPLDRRHAAGPYLRWMNDPEIVHFLEARHRAHDEAAIAAYIEAVNADERQHMFGIFLKVTGRHIGNIKLGPIFDHYRRADMGFLIGEKELWGQGYATEAIRAVTRYAFESLGLNKVTAGLYEENVGSLKAFQKAGFEEEGRRPQQYLCDGRWTSEVLVGRTRDRGFDATANRP